MDRLASLLHRHQVVGLDTSVFIYHIEGDRRYSAAVGAALEALARGEFGAVTSVVTLMEIAVRPLQLGRPDVADEYEILIANYPYLTIVDVDRAVARRAAALRAAYRLRPADAIQLGACLEQSVSGFLTNDKGLQRVQELEIILLDDFAIVE